jgi:hypothetical protein
MRLYVPGLSGTGQVPESIRGVFHFYDNGVCQDLMRKSFCRRRMIVEQPPFSFSEPWRESISSRAEAFLRELRTELSPGHPLPGVNLKASAGSVQADDVLFQLDDGRVCQVHLIGVGLPNRLLGPIITCSLVWKTGFDRS